MFPAGAGMNRSFKLKKLCHYYVPRWRGDEPKDLLKL